MKNKTQRIVSILLVIAMLLSVLPTVAFAEEVEQIKKADSEPVNNGGKTTFAVNNGIPRRDSTVYYRIDSLSDLDDDTYIFITDAADDDANYTHYALLNSSDANNVAGMLSSGASFDSTPNVITAGTGLAWTVTYSGGEMIITDANGNYLADTTDSTGYGLELSTTSCAWTPTVNSDGTFVLTSENGYILSLRTDIDTVGSNDSPLFCMASSTSKGSCNFYLYRTTCTHNYMYSCNYDSTHTHYCSYCGESTIEDCTMSNGTCTSCGYTGDHTITFIVPDGVDAIEPMVCSRFTLPVPTGTPAVNPNNASFVGWVTKIVDNSTTAPTIYNTTTSYVISSDVTLYALYSYAETSVYTLFDGSSSLTIGAKALIVAEEFDYAMSRTQNKNNRASEAITKADNTITVSSADNIAAFTIGYGVDGSNDTSVISFRDENGYLTAASSSSNYLRSSDTLDANSTWAYTVDTTTYVVTLTSQGEYTRNTIRYNASNTPSLFGCYDSANVNLRDIQLYLLTSEEGTVYTTEFESAECAHEFSYTENGDGTHTIECTLGCGYSFTEDCAMLNGTCELCGYVEIVEYTVEFIVPAGVDAIEPIVGSEVTMPVPTGTPDNNTNNATFIGWTTEVVDNSSIAPAIYDTNTVYTLDSDLTLYALYGYGGNMVFELYDGSAALEIGDQVIIVAADYDKALSKTQNTNNRAAADIVKDGTSITVAETDNIAVLTVEYGVNGESNTAQISFLDEAGYLTSASSSSNHLKTATELTANSTWIYSIEADTAIATITAQGDYTRNTIRYNTSSLFACYAADNANLKNIQIYILTAQKAGTYTTVFNAECLHEYTYTTNNDGTHTGICDHCGDIITAPCELNEGTCFDCGYTETVSYTVTFVVPEGVNAISPITATEITFPVPTGTPNNNFNNATFLGWVTNRIVNATSSPNYFDTVTNYTLSENLTVYALYTYGASGATYTLYNGANALKAGDQVIIVAKDFDYALGTQNTSNRAAAEIVKSGNEVTIPSGSEVAILTVGQGIDSNLISLHDGNGYLRAASSSSNQLKITDTLDGNSSWSYVVNAEDYSVALTAQGSYTRNTIRYNKSSALFSCYAAENSQYDVQLYVLSSGGGTYYTTEFSDTCAHSSTTTDTVEATCTSSGSVTVTCNVCGQIVSSSVIAALGHSYDAQESLPTCTTDGYVIYTCIHCGDVYSENLPSEGHAYGEGIPVVEANCTTDGIINFTCVNCGDSYTETILAPGHAYGSGVVTSILSCTTDGVTTYTCANCGNSYAETVKATGHSYGSGSVISKPTCTTDGLTTYTCANCGDSYAETQKATGHNYGNGVVVSAPSCTTDGITTYTCANCQDSYSDVVTAPGHSYGEGIVIEVPLCLTSGTILYTCSNCHESTTQTLDPLGHSYSTTVYPPTCLEDGYTSYMCTSCGDTYTGNITAATGHNYDIVMVDPTCETAGYTSFTCIGCSDAYITDEIQPLGHSYSVTKTDATCTQDGNAVYTCANCANSYSETIPATGHKIVFVPEVAATCFSEGTSEHYKCEACSKLYIDASGTYEIPESYLPIPATGHTLVYVDKVAATCTKNGNIGHYTCSGCGKLYADTSMAYEIPAEYILLEATGHNYKSTVVAPTCTTDGYTSHSCSKCGDTYKTDIVNALNHNYSFSDNGQTHTRTCSNCNEILTEDHAWDQGQDLTDGVCSAYSKVSYTCTICKTVRIETNGEPNHILVFSPETYPTCDAAGCVEHYTCTQCGKYYVDSDCTFELPESYVKVEATGHNYVDGTCTNCGATDAIEPKYEYNEKLSMSMSITVGAEMQVNYTILNARIKNYKSFYVEITKEVAGGENITTVYSLDANNLTNMLNPNTGAHVGYYAIYTGIKASQMGDSFSATLYAVAEDGTIYYGPANTGSIKSFLYEKVAAEASLPELKTLAVDMLNYGAAAQVYFGYDAENLVNADLTEEQKALGTQEIPAAVNTSGSTGSGGAIIPNVTLESKVVLYVNCRYAAAESSNLVVVIKDMDGNVIDEVTPKVLTAKICQAAYSNVGAKQMRQPIQIEMYDNSTLVTQTLIWSIESYVAQTRANTNASEALLNAVNAMLTYGDSAAAYLTASGQ